MKTKTKSEKVQVAKSKTANDGGIVVYHEAEVTKIIITPPIGMFPENPKIITDVMEAIDNVLYKYGK